MLDGFNIGDDHKADFELPDGGRMNIRWKVLKPRTQSVGTVILGEGHSLFIEAYEHICRDWLDRRFQIIAFDWPGQGRSDRYTQGGDTRDYTPGFGGHIKALDHVVKNIAFFVHQTGPLIFYL